MTSRSKLFFIATLIFVFCAGVLATQAEESNEPKKKYTPEMLALADRYISAVPVEQEIMGAVNEMAERVQPDQRILFKSLAQKSIDYDRLRASAQVALVDIFTEKELRAMADFYSTPEGKSVHSKLNKFQVQMQPAMIDVMQTFITRIQENGIVIQP